MILDCYSTYNSFLSASIACSNYSIKKTDQNVLPDDIFRHICTFLSAEEILSPYSLVCRDWHAITDKDIFWETLTKERYTTYKSSTYTTWKATAIQFIKRQNWRKESFKKTSYNIEEGGQSNKLVCDMEGRFFQLLLCPKFIHVKDVAQNKCLYKIQLVNSIKDVRTIWDIATSFCDSYFAYACQTYDDRKFEINVYEKGQKISHYIYTYSFPDCHTLCVYLKDSLKPDLVIYKQTVISVPEYSHCLHIHSLSSSTSRLIQLDSRIFSFECHDECVWVFEEKQLSVYQLSGEKLYTFLLPLVENDYENLSSWRVLVGKILVFLSETHLNGFYVNLEQNKIEKKWVFEHGYPNLIEGLVDLIASQDASYFGISFGNQADIYDCYQGELIKRFDKNIAVHFLSQDCIKFKCYTKRLEMFEFNKKPSSSSVLQKLEAFLPFKLFT